MKIQFFRSIKKFMEKFDKLAIARGNFSCGELERALQYLELYMDEQKGRMQDQLPFLAEIYALLDEPDSVAGKTIFLKLNRQALECCHTRWKVMIQF